MQFSFRLLASVCLCWPAGAAEHFLHMRTGDDGTLLDSLEMELGAGTLRSRANRLQERIRPLFLSLPKNRNGQLSHASVRYALHRMIVDMHGWSIEGLEPNISTYNSTSIVGSGALRAVLPANVESILTDKIGTDGFTLQEIAALASTIEYGVHEQQRIILRRACVVLGLPTAGKMSEEQMRMIIQAYQAVLLIGGGDILNVNMENFSAEDVTRLLRSAPRNYPGWPDTVLFIDDEIESLAFNGRSRTNPFQGPVPSFQMAARVVEQAADHFARHLADQECQEIREDLLTFESGDTGRIRLADFYRAGLTSRFFYTETKEFLQALGALDDSDLLHGPKVIVSNYVLAKVNCLSNSLAYSICCLNECDTLYEQLETGAVAYEFKPHSIASRVADMSSSTVQAPRNLSQSLLRRLDEIASVNGGNILLHSRLFAQWMHQAFPRECPYPHLIGTTTSLSPSAWSKKYGIPYRIDHGGMSRMKVLNSSVDQLEREYAARQLEIDDTVDTEDLMWTLDEETFAVPQQSLAKRLMAWLCESGSHFCLLMVAPIGMLGAIIAKANLFRSDRTAKIGSVTV